MTKLSPDHKSINDLYYLRDIFLQYGDRKLLNNISFMIGKKERIGLIGRNGAGKSTLLKIIADESRPDSGGIELPSGTTVGYLRQEFEFADDKAVLDEALSCFTEANNIQDELDGINEQLAVREDYESPEYATMLERLAELSGLLEHHDINTLEAKAVKVLKGLGFKDSDFTKMISELSGGWKMRVELAKLLLSQPDLLLLDEPTNHLDIESIIWLEKYLRKYEGIVILISHDILFMQNIVNRILEIELGKLNDFKGTYKNYVTEKAQQREIQISSFENQQKAIAQREKTISRFMAKATKTKMAQSMKKQLDKMERIEVAETDTSGMNIRFAEVPRSGRDVIKGVKISKSYGDQNVLDNVDVVIERGERVAFVGQNGQGKTTLAKILIGDLQASSGEVIKGHNLQVSYYAQNQSELLDLKKTVLQVMEDKAPEQMRSKARSILGSFMFSGEDVDKKVSVLSGGERARLALASLIMHPCNLLVLDEPTNHLDIQSKEVLKEALMDYEGTLLVVSHDRDFLSGLTSKIVEFKDKKLYQYLGDIEYYLSKRELEDMRAVEMQKSEVAEEQKAAKREEAKAAEPSLSREELKKLRRQVQYIERDIEKLEAEQAKLNKQMQDPKFYMDPSFVEVSKQHTELQAQIDSKTAEWELVVEQLGE